MRVGPLLLVFSLAAVGPAARAFADAAPPGAPSMLSRVTVLGELGYAYPIGSAENGTETRDVSFGLIPVSVRGTYDLPRGWNAAARFQYAVNIPTLCSSGPDCESSLGRDLVVAVGVGRSLPPWRRLTAHVALDVGWEWFTMKLSDAGVAATRSWNGPIVSLDVFVDMKSHGPWSVGPVVSMDLGVFSHFDINTPVGHAGGSADAALHAWPTLGFRFGRQL
jgi:hypothetical protein